MTRLYVGNIRYSADEASLRALFEAFGPVREVFIGIDRETGRSRGFAFVTMVDKNGVDAAIAGLNGKEVDGRTLVVNEAQPRQARPSGAGAGDGGPGGGGSSGAGGSRERAPSRGGPASRQAPYTGPSPSGRGGAYGGRGGGGEFGERAPKSGKPGSREKDRDKQKFDPDDDW